MSSVFLYQLFNFLKCIFVRKKTQNEKARYKLPTLQVVDFQIALQLKHGWEVEIKWAFIHCDGNKRIGSANGAETIKKQNSQGEKCVFFEL